MVKTGPHSSANDLIERAKRALTIRPGTMRRATGRIVEGSVTTGRRDGDHFRVTRAIHAGTGLVTGVPVPEAAREASRAAMAAGGLERADLALVFASADAYRHGDELLEAVRRVTGAPTTLGCSGAGILTERGEAEAASGVAVMALAGGDDSDFAPLVLSGVDMLDADAGAELARRAGLSTRDTGALVLLADPVALDPDDFLLGLSPRLEPLPVAGGVAGGMPPFQLTPDGLIHGSLVGLLLAETPLVGVAQGCEPIGQPHVVTSCAANVIHSLGGRPPVAVLRETIETVPDYAERVPRFGVFAGLAIDPAKSPLNRGDFLVRSLAGLDHESGAITLPEPVFEGQTLQFQIRDAAAARTDLEAMLERLRVALGQRRPAFGLYVSGRGRGRELFGETGREVALIRERLGEFPLVGFFGAGEFGAVGGENFFHTLTGVLLLHPAPPAR
jgi:small ligand-binding sensory domain FIST